MSVDVNTVKYAFQKVRVSFDYVAKTDIDLNADKDYDSHYDDILMPMAYDMIDNGAIKYNNGENLELYVDRNGYSEYVEITDCLDNKYNKNDSGKGIYEIAIPLANVTIKSYSDYEIEEYVTEVIDYYITNDSFDMDKIIALFNKYYGEYFELTNFKAEAIPFTYEEIADFDICMDDEYEPPEDDYKEMIEERMMEEMERR